MQGRPDFEDVYAFLAVVEAGSFTAAGRRLGVAKSNVSRRISRLEEQLGARLLERTTRSLRLTDVGEAYHARVRQAVDQLDEADRAVRQIHDAPAGRVRFTAPGDMGPMLGEELALFTQRYPEVSVEVELTQRAVDLIGEGFDVALRAGNMPDSSLVARRIAVQRFPMVASLDYIARRGSPETLAELADHDCVLFRGKAGRSRWTLEGPDGDVEVEVTGTLSANDFNLIHHAVEAGAGIGFVPLTVATGTSRWPGAGTSKLQVVLPGYYLPGSTLQVVYPSARFLPSRVRVFTDFLIERVGARIKAMEFECGKQARARGEAAG